MKIICNGEEKEIRTGLVLEEFILELKLNPDTVVAEYDGKIIRRDQYKSLELVENSKLELIRFVGGG